MSTNVIVDNYQTFNYNIPPLTADVSSYPSTPFVPNSAYAYGSFTTQILSNGIPQFNVSKFESIYQSINVRLIKESTTNPTFTAFYANARPSVIPNGKVFKIFTIKLVDIYPGLSGPGYSFAPPNITINSTVVGASVTFAETNRTYTDLIDGTREYIYTFTGTYVSTGPTIIQSDTSFTFSIPSGKTNSSFNLKTFDGDIATQPPLCFHSSTQVQTSNGLIPITELKSGESIYDSNNKLVKIDSIIKHGPTDTFVRISKGSIDGMTPYNDLLVTPGHKVLFNNKSVRALDIVNHSDIKLEKLEPSNVYSIITSDNKYVSCEGIYCVTLTKDKLSDKNIIYEKI